VDRTGPALEECEERREARGLALEEWWEYGSGKGHKDLQEIARRRPASGDDSLGNNNGLRDGTTSEARRASFSGNRQEHLRDRAKREDIWDRARGATGEHLWKQARSSLGQWRARRAGEQLLETGRDISGIAQDGVGGRISGTARGRRARIPGNRREHPWDGARRGDICGSLKSALGRSDNDEGNCADGERRGWHWGSAGEPAREKCRGGGVGRPERRKRGEASYGEAREDQ
jgi:hypothetical protein